MEKCLVLYSDQIRGVSDALDEHVLRLLEGTQHRVAFVPAATDRKRRYFQRAESYYGDMGISSLLHFDVGEEYEEAALPLLLACDAIHLGSGDTDPFLAALTRRGLLDPLRTFAARGGVLIGMSAGAMLFAKSTAICAIDEPGAQSATSGKNAKSKRGGALLPRALDLVAFDFWPHFEGDARTAKALAAHATKSSRAIYACHDSEGLVVEGDTVILVGEPTVFRA